MKKWGLFFVMAALVVTIAGASVTGDKTAVIIPDNPLITASTSLSL